jgi:hypothetical protein
MASDETHIDIDSGEEEYLEELERIELEGTLSVAPSRTST